MGDLEKILEELFAEEGDSDILIVNPGSDALIQLKLCCTYSYASYGG